MTDQPSPALAEAREIVSRMVKRWPYHNPEAEALAYALLRTVVAEETVEAVARALHAAPLQRLGKGSHVDAALPPTDAEMDNARAVLTALLERAREGTS